MHGKARMYPPRTMLEEEDQSSLNSQIKVACNPIEYICDYLEIANNVHILHAPPPLPQEEWNKLVYKTVGQILLYLVMVLQHTIFS